MHKMYMLHLILKNAAVFIFKFSYYLDQQMKLAENYFNIYHIQKKMELAHF